MQLAKIEAGGSQGGVKMPERYARALSSAGNDGQVPATIQITTPDGRTHSCDLRQMGKRRQWILGRPAQLLRSLVPVAAGDLLRFTPMGRGAASVALVRVGASPAMFRSGAPSPWRGLEPTDSRRYTVPLKAHTLRHGEQSMPARYAAAAFGQAPELGAGTLEVTGTSASDGSMHTLRLCKHSLNHQTQLSRLGRLLASLGAAVGGSLCLEPAGPLAARASLVKAAAAAAAAGEEEEDDEEAEEQQQQQQQQQAQQEQQQLPPSSHSAPATTAVGGDASAAAAPLPTLAAMQDNPAALWSTADQLLAALETQGGVAPSQAAAYRRAFAALPSHSWRHAHLSLLRGFVDSGDWAAAAAWMAEC